MRLNLKGIQIDHGSRAVAAPNLPWKGAKREARKPPDPVHRAAQAFQGWGWRTGRNGPLRRPPPCCSPSRARAPHYPVGARGVCVGAEKPLWGRTKKSECDVAGRPSGAPEVGTLRAPPLSVTYLSQRCLVVDPHSSDLRVGARVPVCVRARQLHFTFLVPTQLRPCVSRVRG